MCAVSPYPTTRPLSADPAHGNRLPSDTACATISSVSIIPISRPPLRRTAGSGPYCIDDSVGRFCGSSYRRCADLGQHTQGSETRGSGAQGPGRAQISNGKELGFASVVSADSLFAHTHVLRYTPLSFVASVNSGSVFFGILSRKTNRSILEFSAQLPASAELSAMCIEGVEEGPCAIPVAVTLAVRLTSAWFRLSFRKLRGVSEGDKRTRRRKAVSPSHKRVSMQMKPYFGILPDFFFFCTHPRCSNFTPEIFTYIPTSTAEFSFG
ncbi:hypothetical protein FN846DRAFT_25815 [Sphaerosporella brunnea]|uniref:Uncharacterized protein n=1 Tax=Sphaerosporella brunnea TaxID=1250544 RepID=A0A5J5EVM7_9PEZI|nr:hypothetical protein FN846DRAFT_25815 [Sphaerosporella brunnea]